MPLNLANPAWVDAAPDLKYLVVSVKLPASAKRGDGMAELEAAVSRLHAQRLDRERPLWCFFLLEGLGPSASGLRRAGLYSQFHHAAVDGQAAVAVAQVILDTSPEGRNLEIRPSKRIKTLRLGLGQMLRGAIANEASQVAGIIRNLPSTLGTLAGAARQALSQSALLRGKGRGDAVSKLSLAPRMPFNQSVTAERAFAGVSLPLPQLKLLGVCRALGRACVEAGNGLSLGAIGIGATVAGRAPPTPPACCLTKECYSPVVVVPGPFLSLQPWKAVGMWSKAAAGSGRCARQTADPVAGASAFAR